MEETFGSCEVSISKPFTSSVYECACGKVYKSYPALYTHIKNKHQGKAPGPIKKPNIPCKKRGRPVVQRSKTSLQTQQYISSCNYLSSQFQDYQLQQVKHPNITSKDCITNISRIIQQLPMQDINRGHLHQIQAITEMNVFMLTFQKRQSKGYIGDMLAQLLKEVSQSVKWPKFKHFYILLMLLLQHLIKSNHQNILEKGSVDTLCDQINDFIQFRLGEMTERYKLSDLGIFEHRNVLNIFHWFFNWVMVNNYTSYRISLNDHFNREGSQSQL